MHSARGRTLLRLDRCTRTAGQNWQKDFSRKIHGPIRILFDRKCSALTMKHSSFCTKNYIIDTFMTNCHLLWSSVWNRMKIIAICSTWSYTTKVSWCWIIKLCCRIGCAISRRTHWQVRAYLWFPLTCRWPGRTTQPGIAKQMVVGYHRWIYLPGEHGRYCIWSTADSGICAAKWVYNYLLGRYLRPVSYWNILD